MSRLESDQDDIPPQDRIILSHDAFVEIRRQQLAHDTYAGNLANPEIGRRQAGNGIVPISGAFHPPPNPPANPQVSQPEHEERWRPETFHPRANNPGHPLMDNMGPPPGGGFMTAGDIVGFTNVNTLRARPRRRDPSDLLHTGAAGGGDGAPWAEGTNLSRAQQFLAQRDRDALARRMRNMNLDGS